ncbi:MAG: hypothetical protein WA584_11475 [Pyrinomonadaceae bacterium]
MGRASRQAPVRLAEKLRIIRESLGLSQGGMLKHLGLNEEDGLFRSSISGYELGTRLPPYNVLLAYARSANIYVEVLIDDEIDLPKKLPSKIKSEGIKI